MDDALSIGDRVRIVRCVGLQAGVGRTGIIRDIVDSLDHRPFWVQFDDPPLVKALGHPYGLLLTALDFGRDDLERVS